MNVIDKYPSRTVEKKPIIERQDPVLYGDQNGAKGPLDATQLRDYEENGFLFLDGFFNQKEVSRFKEELEYLRQSDEIKNEPATITEPNSGDIRSIFRVFLCSEVFQALSRHPYILGAMEQILNSNVYLHQSRVNFKPGFEGKEFYWHSDFETWHAEDGMPNMRAISCSITLTENNEFNGPLMLVPGSHKYFIPCIGETPENHYEASLKKQAFGVPDKTSVKMMVDKNGLIAPKGPAGSVLFFECNTLHASSGNISPFPRSNVFFVYNSVENKLEKPFAANSPRPEFLASHDYTPLKPIGTWEQPDKTTAREASQKKQNT